jgi:hypothetical protein
MSRPDPIEYAERLYVAIRDANFSPISFLAFGNAVKDGVPMRSMPRIAVEPFMRVVGEMLNLEEAASNDTIVDGEVVEAVAELTPGGADAAAEPAQEGAPGHEVPEAAPPVAESPTSAKPRKGVGGKR